MLLSADIHIHRQVRVNGLRSEGRLGVVRVQEAQVVPGRVDKGVHRVRLPLGRAAAPAGGGTLG